MRLEDYRMIEVGFIDSEIESTKKTISELLDQNSRGSDLGNDVNRIGHLTEKLNFLNLIKTKMVSLEPLVVASYDAGKNHISNFVCFDNPKGRFINSEIVLKDRK